MAKSIYTMSNSELSRFYELVDSQYSSAATNSDEEIKLGNLLQRIENEIDSREMADIEEWYSDPS